MSSCVVELRNAILAPSGAQTGVTAPFGKSVIVQASPPSSDSKASWLGLGLPVSSLSSPRTKTRCLPSGDQRGWESCLPLVIRTGGSLLLVAMVQIEDS